MRSVKYLLIYVVSYPNDKCLLLVGISYWMGFCSIRLYGDRPGVYSCTVKNVLDFHSTDGKERLLTRANIWKWVCIRAPEISDRSLESEMHFEMFPTPLSDEILKFCPIPLLLYRDIRSMMMHMIIVSRKTERISE